MLIQISGSWGSVFVDPKDGKVLKRDDGGEGMAGGYRFIDRIDLKGFDGPEGDILDFGYWDAAGKWYAPMRDLAERA